MFFAIEDLERYSLTIRTSRAVKAADTSIRVRSIPEAIVGEDIIIDVNGDHPETRAVSAQDTKYLTIPALAYDHNADVSVLRPAILFDRAIVFNESGNDRDYRFEGATDENLLSLDGGNDNIGLGIVTPTTIHTDAALFGDVVPKLEILTGTAVGTYEECVVIRHADANDTGVYRVTGLLLKLYNEESENGSDKMGGIILDSSSGYANLPDLHLVTANVKRLTIKDDGKVGIGTDAPGSMLHVAGDITLDDGAGDSPALKFIGGSNDDTAQFRLIDSAAGQSDLELKLCGTGASAKFIIADSNGDIRHQFNANGSVDLNWGMEPVDVIVSGDTDSYLLFIDGSEDRVAIGTSVPHHKFTIEGTMAMKEQASADADYAAYGQLWVKNATPCELWFTDDAGADTKLA